MEHINSQIEKGLLGDERLAWNRGGVTGGYVATSICKRDAVPAYMIVIMRCGFRLAGATRDSTRNDPLRCAYSWLITWNRSEREIRLILGQNCGFDMTVKRSRKKIANGGNNVWVWI